MVNFSQKQQKLIAQLLTLFQQAPYSPPGVKECQEMVGKDVYQAIIDLEILVEVSTDVVFRQGEYQNMLKKVSSENEMTLAQFRDVFKTSRKYAQAFLEHMDVLGITVRIGDIHRKRSI
jgi:selenocysteine-specific elongation factor